MWPASVEVGLGVGDKGASVGSSPAEAAAVLDGGGVSVGTTAVAVAAGRGAWVNAGTSVAVGNGVGVKDKAVAVGRSTGSGTGVICGAAVCDNTVVKANAMTATITAAANSHSQIGRAGVGGLTSSGSGIGGAIDLAIAAGSSVVVGYVPLRSYAYEAQ